MKKIFLTTIFIAIVTFLQTVTVKAATPTVLIEVDREYTVTTNADVDVKETRIVQNTSSDKIITKSGNSEVFTITALYEDLDNERILREMVNTARITDKNGNSLNFNVSYNSGSAIIDVPYPSSITSGSSYTFILEYTNTQLAQKVGALTDIFIQAFSDDFSFSSSTVEYNYSTTLRVPNLLGEENFVIPDPQKKTSDLEFDVYEFSQDQLIGTYVWVQRGKIQYYDFEIKQPVPATEDFNTGNKNQYRMVIPRDMGGEKIDQKVYFTNFSPEPIFIEEDGDGNLIGVFEFPSHKSGEIVISGYSVVETLDGFDIENAGTLSDLEGVLPPVYYSASQYWEVDAEPIQTKASELKGDSSDIYTIVSSTYQFIVDSIDYSQVKRFGLNIRQGALKTLNGGAAVCMEYSDLYIALLRAQGIPARAAFGYGYDSKDPADQQELHQWVQVYIPSTGRWLNIDPTWGENGPALIGGDMNHFLTHVASENPNEPATLSGKTYGNKVSFEDVQFSIQVRDKLPNTPSRTVEQVLTDYKKSESGDIENFSSQLKDKFLAGINSFSEDGLKLQNSAQLIVLASGVIAASILFAGFLVLSRLIRRGRKSAPNKQEVQSIRINQY